MNAPHERLAEALTELRTLQDQGIVAIQGSEISALARRTLLRAGYLRPIMRGWYIPGAPGESPGDSTPWFVSFWTFAAHYLDVRFGDAWCLSPEQSIALHVGDRSVPRQLLVRAPRGRNKPTELAHGVSIFEWRREPLPAAQVEVREGLRLQRLPIALINASAQEFSARPTHLRTALALITDASELLRPLIEGSHPVVAGRLVGAMRNIGRESLADEVRGGMEAAGFAIRETDPFAAPMPRAISARERSPHVLRMQLQWAHMRDTVIGCMPRPPGLPSNPAEYLRQVDEIYTSDAYHSLSIEGYRVSTALIERVRSGTWNPQQDAGDRQDADALAAHGYWRAFQAVRGSVERIVTGANAGVTVSRDHGAWYRSMFAPSVEAGIVEPSVLAGYRCGQVYIRYSRHVPPSAEAVRDAMPAFFELLEAEPEAAVRTVLGHFFFVYLHPYMDGNGRMGRFLMNAALASGGYPWRVIPLAERATYMASLEAASVDGNIRPFADFLGHLIAAPVVAAPAR